MGFFTKLRFGLSIAILVPKVLESTHLWWVFTVCMPLLSIDPLGDERVIVFFGYLVVQTVVGVFLLDLVEESLFVEVLVDLVLGFVDVCHVLAGEAGFSVGFSFSYLGGLVDSLNFLGVFDHMILLINPIIVLQWSKIPLRHLIRAHNPIPSLKVLQHLLLTFLLKELLPVEISAVSFPQGLHFILEAHVVPLDFLVTKPSQLQLFFLKSRLIKILPVQVLLILLPHLRFEVVHFLLSFELLLLHVPEVLFPLGLEIVLPSSNL